MTSSNGNISRVTGPLCGEFTGHRWIPLTKASQWRGALMFSLICSWTNGWEDNPHNPLCIQCKSSNSFCMKSIFRDNSYYNLCHSNVEGWCDMQIDISCLRCVYVEMRLLIMQRIIEFILLHTFQVKKWIDSCKILSTYISDLVKFTIYV